jgi:hypothetical protein
MRAFCFLSLGLLSCSNVQECLRVEGGAGKWTDLGIPHADEYGEWGRPLVGDGSMLLDLGGIEFKFATNTSRYKSIAEINLATGETTITPTTMDFVDANLVAVETAATADSVFVFTSKEDANIALLLDRKTYGWSDVHAPAEFGLRSALEVIKWRGRYLVWGGALWGGNKPDAKDTWVYDGMTFDPTKRIWSKIGAARKPFVAPQLAVSSWHVQAVTTDQGIFIWGIEPEGDKEFSRLYHPDEDTWEDVKIEGDGPGLWEDADMVYTGTDVYVAYGRRSQTDGWQDAMYRVNLDERKWHKVDTRGYSVRGNLVWANGRIVTYSGCGAPLIYDPKKDSWTVGTSVGDPHSGVAVPDVGPFMVINQAGPGDSEDPHTYVFDPFSK